MADKSGYAQRKFKDAGTGQVFQAGHKVTLPEGQYANYAAAGLVGEKTPEKAASAAEPTKKDA